MCNGIRTAVNAVSKGFRFLSNRWSPTCGAASGGKAPRSTSRGYRYPANANRSNRRQVGWAQFPWVVRATNHGSSPSFSAALCARGSYQPISIAPSPRPRPCAAVRAAMVGGGNVEIADVTRILFPRSVTVGGAPSRLTRSHVSQIVNDSGVNPKASPDRSGEPPAGLGSRWRSWIRWPLPDRRHSATRASRGDRRP